MTQKQYIKLLELQKSHYDTTIDTHLNPFNLSTDEEAINELATVFKIFQEVFDILKVDE